MLKHIFTKINESLNGTHDRYPGNQTFWGGILAAPGLQWVANPENFFVSMPFKYSRHQRRAWIVILCQIV